MKRLVRILVVAGFAFAVGSCDIIGLVTGGLGKTAPDPPSFDVGLFEQNLVNQVGTQWDGYAYTINQNGQLVASGAFGNWVRGGMAANITTPIYGASVNKFVAAIGVMKALQLNPDIDLDDTIDGFLPPQWSATGSLDFFIRNVTIRQLLTHTSRIPGSFNSDYATLMGIAQNGLVQNNVPQPPATGTAYSNANYGFLRIFLSTVNGASYGSVPLAELEDSIIVNYQSFMKTNVFDRAGVAGAGITPTVAPSAARYYQWNNAQDPWTIGDRSWSLASGGYYFAVRDLAQLLAYVNHSNQVISKQMRDLMYANFFGLSDGQAPPLSPNGQFGFYYSKAGALTNNSRGMRAIVVILPQKVEVVFMANSSGGAMDGTVALRNAIFAAYDAAW